MQKYTGSEIWKNDCFHVAFRIKPATPFQLPDYEYGFALTPEGEQIYRWISPDKKDKGELVPMEVVIKREKSFTIYEIAIPKKELEPL